MRLKQRAVTMLWHPVAASTAKSSGSITYTQLMRSVSGRTGLSGSSLAKLAVKSQGTR